MAIAQEGVIKRYFGKPEDERDDRGQMPIFHLKKEKPPNDEDLPELTA